MRDAPFFSCVLLPLERNVRDARSPGASFLVSNVKRVCVPPVIEGYLPQRRTVVREGEALAP